MGNTITIRNRHDEPVMVIDLADWELDALEARERELSRELAQVRRDLKQLRDVHEQEGAR